MYSQKLIDHFDNPKNVGSFDKKDNNVGTGLVGAPACGDVMKRWHYRRCQVQDFWLWFRHRIFQPDYRMGQGKDLR